MNNYDNDLFYLCSLIEYIARKTYNTKEYVVNKIGKDFLKKEWVHDTTKSRCCTAEIITRCQSTLHQHNFRT